MSFPKIRIVMVETSHPGNIGAAARAMKNMQLDRLYLVNPHRFPDAEATARSSGAEDILEGAIVCASLPEALEGCHLAYGASARAQRTIPWPQLDARSCAEQIATEADETEVALVFGREHSGLSNEELESCNYLVHIPCNPNYSSLNVAAAIQVITYELHMARLGEWQPKTPKREEALASADELAGLMAHLEQVILDTGFLDPENPRQLMRRLRRLFLRAQLEKTEMNILRGILTSVDKLG
jgi:TrmH family RNA methyltransferase